MARTNDPNSATSQFYINVTNNTILDCMAKYGYCVFGQVISGMDIADQIVQFPYFHRIRWSLTMGFPIMMPEWMAITMLMFTNSRSGYVYRRQAMTAPALEARTPLSRQYKKAIDVVNEPGHVVPTPATYTGAGNVDLDFKGKAITVRAIEPRNFDTVTTTVINCQGSSANKHRAFNFHTGEDANSVVKGLTIINGYQTSGGAILCQTAAQR